MPLTVRGRRAPWRVGLALVLLVAGTWLLIDAGSGAPRTALMAAEAQVEHVQAALAEVDAAETVATPARDVGLLEAELSRVLGQLQRALELVEAHRIRAPVPGIVHLGDGAPGDLVHAGATLASIEVPGRYLVRLMIPREVAASRAAADAVRVVIGDQPALRASLAELRVPGVDGPVTGLAVLAAAADVTEEQPVDVLVPLARAERPVVAPEQALVTSERGPALLLVTDGRVRAVPVRVGARRDGVAEVFGAVAVGDHVVVSDLDRVRDGTAVATRMEETP